MLQAPAEFEGPLGELYERHLAAVLPSVEGVEQFDHFMEQYCAEPDPLFEAHPGFEWVRA
jgi:hypothetical protein